MNFVGGLHYFIYLDFSLLILFLKTDADYHSTCSFKDVMESIRPTNTENNEANGVELEFTLFCEKNVENAVEMLNSALNFIQNKVQYYLTEKTQYHPEIPLELGLIQIIQSILKENLKQLLPDDLKNLCNNSWATYSNGIVPLLLSVKIQSVPVEFPQEQQNNLPMLTCTFHRNFRLFILTLYDPENPSRDIRFLYIYAFSYELFAYIREIAKDHNEGNINRNQS